MFCYEYEPFKQEPKNVIFWAILFHVLQFYYIRQWSSASSVRDDRDDDYADDDDDGDDDHGELKQCTSNFDVS